MRALLLSGGLDSSALAWSERPDVCVTIDYGQCAGAGERGAAASICRELDLTHRIVVADLAALGSGAMAGRPVSDVAAAVEFWPYRNQMLITLAAMFLQPVGLSEIIVGSVRTDLHADGSAAFFRSIDRTMRLQEGRVRVAAPARRMSSVELLRKVGFPRELVGLTFSCHVHEFACGQCGGCVKHREVVESAFGLAL